MTGPNYQLSDFSDDGTLKVSALLWLVIAFLARHVLLLLMGGLSTFMLRGRGIDTGGFSALYSTPFFLLVSAPAVAIIVASVRRAPGAGPLIRGIWRNGRLLLSIAAGLDIGLLVCHWAFGWLSINEIIIVTVFLDVYILLYLARSVRVRDTFEDFPMSRPEEASSRN